MADDRIYKDETFLHYAEATDRWTCPSCETELEQAETVCFLCGCTKQVWFAQQEELRRNPQRYETPPLQNGAMTAQPQKTNAWVRVVAAILVLAVLIGLLVLLSNAAEPTEQTLTITQEIEMEEEYSAM